MTRHDLPLYANLQRPYVPHKLWLFKIPIKSLLIPDDRLTSSRLNISCSRQRCQRSAHILPGAASFMFFDIDNMTSFAFKYFLTSPTSPDAKAEVVDKAKLKHEGIDNKFHVNPTLIQNHLKIASNDPASRQSFVPTPAPILCKDYINGP